LLKININIGVVMVRKWIHKAVKRLGAYRKSVQRRYGKRGFTERGTIKREVIARDAQRSGRIGRQARLARTLGRI